MCVCVCVSYVMYLQDSDRPVAISGSLLGYIERMDDEYTKILQGTDAHSQDYVTKLELDLF